MASPRLNELGLWPLSNDTLPVAMSLQKEAFHVVAAFLEEGLEADLGGLVDVLTMMTTSRLADRRPMLRGIGMKFQHIADTKLDRWLLLQKRVDDADNEYAALVDNDVPFALKPSIYVVVEAMVRAALLREEMNRAGKFFDCCKKITGEMWFPLTFHDKVLTPTFAKWMRL